MATTHVPHLPPLVGAPSEPRAEPRSRDRLPQVLLLGLALGILLTAAGAALESRWQTKPAPRPASLLVAAAEPGRATGAIAADGVLIPVRDTRIGTPEAGLLRRVEIKVNERVRRGQILARLDALPARAAVTVAEAALVGAEAAAFEAEGGLRDLALAIPPGLDLDRLDPDTKLEIEGAFQTAQVRMARAFADVEAREAELTVARQRARRTVIRSPFAGVVVEKLAEPGDVLEAGAPLFRLTSPPHELHAALQVEEGAVPRIHLGDRTKIRVAALPGRENLGQVVQIGHLSPSTDGGAARATVTVALANTRGDLLPGMGASAFIQPREAKPVLRVPATALRFVPPDGPAAPEPGVWLVDRPGDVLRRAKVEVTARDGDYAEVWSPELTVGSKVVVGQAAWRGSDR